MAAGLLGAIDGSWAVKLKLVDRVRKVLLGPGQGLCCWRAGAAELDGEEFCCELLAYHLELRRYVAIELKAVKFDASFLGQLGVYTAVVDDVLAKEGDKPTICLLLCRNKKKVVAEYALPSVAELEAD